MVRATESLGEALGRTLLQRNPRTVTIPCSVLHMPREMPFTAPRNNRWDIVISTRMSTPGHWARQRIHDFRLLAEW